MTRVQGEHRFATCLDGVHPDRVVTEPMATGFMNLVTYLRHPVPGPGG
jgi:hypothetical protein